MSSDLIKKSIILLKSSCVFLYIVLLIGIDVHGQDLPQFISTGVNNNSGLKAKYKAFEAAISRVSQEGALPDPGLSFGYFVQPVETRIGPMQARISLSQMFPWFGTLKKKKSVSALLAESKYQEFLQARNVLIAEIKKSYYQIHELQAQIKLLQDELEIMDTYKSLVITSFSTGKGTLSDIILIDLQREEIKVSIEILEVQLSLLTVQFNLLIEEKEDRQVIPEKLPDPSYDYQLLMPDLLAKNPQLNAIEQQILAMKERQSLTVLNSLPRIGVGLDYTIVGEGSNPNFADNGKDALMPMVTMTLPIFRSKYKSAVTEVSLKADELEYRKQDYLNSLHADYQRERFELEKTQRRFRLFEQQIRRINELIELFYTAYSNSGKGFDDILKAQQQILQYRMEKETIIKQYYTALAKLELITAKGLE